VRDALFRTRITELFGIEHPILVGGLMWLSEHNFVSAVARAGGIGFITPRSYPTNEEYRDGIRRCRDLSEGRPFGVNLYVSSRPAENAALIEMADILIEEGVRFVETAGGSPADILPRLKGGGVTVIHKATTLRHAAKAAGAGADAIALVGTECGGHPGMAGLTSIVLAARAAEDLEVPIVIGGGVGTGGQIAGLLGMGADGALLGSRAMTADESWIHDAYREHLFGCDETSTMLVMQSVKNPYRCLTNESALAVAELERQYPGEYDRYKEHAKGAACREAYLTGNYEHGILSLGPSIAFSRKRETMEQLFDQLIDEAKSGLTRLGGLTVR
jgi:nitronate monooxygenase